MSLASVHLMRSSACWAAVAEVGMVLAVAVGSDGHGGSDGGSIAVVAKRITNTDCGVGS